MIFEKTNAISLKVVVGCNQGVTLSTEPPIIFISVGLPNMHCLSVKRVVNKTIILQIFAIN